MHVKYVLSTLSGLRISGPPATISIDNLLQSDIDHIIGALFLIEPNPDHPEYRR